MENVRETARRETELLERKLSEIPATKMSEEQRIQQAEVAGKQFVFGTREQREMQQLDRVSNQICMRP